MSFSCFWSTGVTVGDIYSRAPAHPPAHAHLSMQGDMDACTPAPAATCTAHSCTDPFNPPAFNLSCVEKRKPGIWFFVSPFTSYSVHSVHSLESGRSGWVTVDGFWDQATAFSDRRESGDPAFVQFATLPFFFTSLSFGWATYRYLLCPLFGGRGAVPVVSAQMLVSRSCCPTLSFSLSRSRTDSIFNLSRTITYSFQRITEASLNGAVVGESRGWEIG